MYIYSIFLCQKVLRYSHWLSIGAVSTFAGSGVVGLLDGLGTIAMFYNCRGLAVDNYGNLFVADSSNNAIRKVTPAGTSLAVLDSL